MAPCRGYTRAVANAAWERVKVWEERTRVEGEKLKAILAQAGLSARERINQIVALFAEVRETFWAACERFA